MKRRSNKILSALLVVTLICGIAPQAWAADPPVETNTDETLSIEPQADEVTASPGWNLIGTCEWQGNAGDLLIRPANNGERGELPPGPEANKIIRSGRMYVKFEGNIVCNESMASMFSGCNDLKIIDFSGLDMSNVTDMSNLFKGCRSLESIDFGALDTSKVENMSDMFSGCVSLKSIDFGALNASKVTDMSTMFSGCTSLASIDFNGLDAPNLTNMSGMFKDCSSLDSIDFGALNAPKVSDMNNMFSGCTSLESIDFNGFATSRVENMSGMFSGCSSLTSLDLDALNTSTVTDMSNMLHGCSRLVSLDLSALDTSNVADMSGMFGSCGSLTSLELDGLDTSKVTDMSGMFSDCSNLTSLDLGGLDTSNVTNMSGMLSYCTSLASLELDGLDTSKVTDMSGMFWGCSSLTSLDLSGLNTSKVTDMSLMFRDCRNLTSLNLSGFDTRKETSGYLGFDIFIGPITTPAPLPLELVSLGEHFTFQNQLPDTTWYNAAGESFTRDTIPVGVAGTYATSMKWFEAPTVTLSETVKTVAVDADPLTLTATVAPEQKEAFLTWTSSDPSVASVASGGKVTVHKAGTATITASVDGVSATCALTVTPLTINATNDSSTDGQIFIEDAKTARALQGYELQIKPSAHAGSAHYEETLLASVSQQLGKQGTLSALVYVPLVNSATGAEIDYSLVNDLFPLSLSLNIAKARSARAADDLSLWEVDESGNARKVADAPENGTFRVQATLPATYAVIATPQADSSDPSGTGTTIPNPNDPQNPTTPPAGDNTQGGTTGGSQDTGTTGNAGADASSDGQAGAKSPTALAQTGDPLILDMTLCVACAVLSVLLLSVRARREQR